MTKRGGVAAAHGFFYQYLVTVEVLLDLYESSNDGWIVEVDRVTQDAADILIYAGSGSAPEQAIQVKASIDRTTRMSKPDVVEIAKKLASEHPQARKHVLRTNRTLTDPAQREADRWAATKPTMNAPQVIMDCRAEYSMELAAILLKRFEELRMRGRGGMGERLAQVMLDRLYFQVFVCGSHPSQQQITRADVETVLDEPVAALAGVVGERAWGRVFDVVPRKAIDRASVTAFLDNELPLTSLLDSAAPSAGAITGMSGQGKSAAVGVWAEGRREHYAFTIWLDASSPGVLVQKMQRLFKLLQAPEDAPEDARAAADSFRALMEKLSVPWLIVFDSAPSFEDVRHWIPQSGYGHVVLTSTDSGWPHDSVPSHQLGGLTDREAVELIKLRLSDHNGKLDASDDTAALTIARHTGMWALAIDLACTWVRQRNGSYETLGSFADRLQAWDFTEIGQRVGSYPTGISELVKEMQSDFSAEAQALFSLCILSGGRGIPTALLKQWGEERGFELSEALGELRGSSIASFNMQIGGTPTVTDEMLEIHDGIVFAYTRLELEVNWGHVLGWSACCIDFLEESVQKAEALAASQILPMVDSFLANLMSMRIESSDGRLESCDGAPVRLLLQNTILMHNVGMLALLDGRFAYAAKWLPCAITLRESLVAHVADQRAFAATQIQTISIWVTTLLKLRCAPKVGREVERVLGYARAPGAFDGDYGLRARTALGDILKNARTAEVDSELLIQLEAIVRECGDAVPQDSPMQRRIQLLQSATVAAGVHAEKGEWGEAVDLLLQSVQMAGTDGMLAHDCVEGVLDLGLLLIGGYFSQLPDDPAPEWRAAMCRIASWLEIQEQFDSSQKVRSYVFQAVATQDAEEMRTRIARLETDLREEKQVGAWLALASHMEENLRNAEWVERPLRMLDSLPGINVIRLTGANDVEFVTFRIDDAPGISLYLPKHLATTDTTADDPLLREMRQAGFPKNDPDNSRVLSDWLFFGDQVDFELLDGAGVSRVSFEVAEEERPWLVSVAAAKHIMVVVGDVAGLDAREILSHPSLAYVPIQYADGSPTLVDTPIQSGSWWQRVRALFRPQSARKT